MKRLWIVLLSVALLLVVSGALLAQSPTEKTLDQFLTAWHKAAAVADEKVYFGSMAPGFVFLGTDAGERWEREAFVKFAEPYFKRESAWVFWAISRHITLAADGQSAWFDELLESKSYWLSRGSGVLVKVAGDWKLAQYNLAFTIPNEVSREVKTVIERFIDKSKIKTEKLE